MLRLLLLGCLTVSLAFGGSAPEEKPSPRDTEHSLSNMFLRSMANQLHIEQVPSIMKSLFENVTIPENIIASKPKLQMTDGRYYLYPMKLDWYQASLWCFSLGKQLATFDTEDEYYQLLKLFEDNSENNPNASYWTGASDLLNTNSYKWFTTDKSLTFKKWANHEPNQTVVNGEVQHCIKLCAGTRYRMVVSQCSQTNYVTCDAKPREDLL